MPVLVLDGVSTSGRGSGDLAPLLRRLRRAARLEVAVGGAECFGPGRPLRWPGAGDVVPAAVVVRCADHPSSIAGLAVLVARCGEVPVVAVVDGGREALLAALRAGAEEVVEADGAGATALERAVLAAVTRRVADRREHPATARDALTGLATRAQLDAQLPRLLSGLSTGGGELSVLYCDLDRLKVINDSLGHGVGDAVIVEAARRLRSAVRTADDVVRVGGDEFVVVLRGAGAAAAEEVAGRVVAGFVDPVEVDDHRLPVGVSVGLAVARSGESAAALLERADRALYQAKRRGRGRVSLAEEAPAAKGGLAPTLHEALVRERLELEPRPVVAPGGRLVGHRFVPAWPTESVADPWRLARPYDVAEESGLSPALFAWTARALGSVPDTTTSPVSLRQFVDMPRAVLAGSPARRLEAAWAGSPVDPSTVVLLVDERLLLDADAVRPPLLDLARAGVRVGVSGYGAAHASLTVLERHPFDSVWLDRDAVDGAAGCAVRRARLKAVVEVASALGQQVVAPAPRSAEDAAVLDEVGGVAVERAALDLRVPALPATSRRAAVAP